MVMQRAIIPNVIKLIHAFMWRAVSDISSWDYETARIDRHHMPTAIVQTKEATWSNQGTQRPNIGLPLSTLGNITSNPLSLFARSYYRFYSYVTVRYIFVYNILYDNRCKISLRIMYVWNFFILTIRVIPSLVLMW